jgi:hypothetical protein
MPRAGEVTGVGIGQLERRRGGGGGGSAGRGRRGRMRSGLTRFEFRMGRVRALGPGALVAIFAVRRRKG